MPHVPDEALQIAESFGAVARELAAHADVDQVLQKIVDLAVEHLEACDFAGISLVEKRQITSPASSNDIPRILDAIQSEVDEGPCIDAIKEHEVFETGDLRGEKRWPKFSARAYEETGVQSVISFRLFVEQDTMGALNVYAKNPDAFDDSDAALGAVFAVHAAVALSAARLERGLEQKAESRDVIGQAKGVLMARGNLDEDAAFLMLKQASQRMNLKLRDVARRVADGQPLA